jgi:hypothetical protein
VAWSPLSVDGAATADFTAEDVAEVIASGETDDQWEGTDGVPEFLTHQQYIDWFASIGIDAMSLKHIEVLRDGITAQVYSLNDEGKQYMTTDKDGTRRLATHTVTIPIR